MAALASGLGEREPPRRLARRHRLRPRVRSEIGVGGSGFGRDSRPAAPASLDNGSMPRAGSAGGAAGLAVFTSRGAGIGGAAGFCGSGALPPGFLTPPREAVGVSANEAFDGTLIPRCRARRVDELPRDDFLDRARCALHLDAVIAFQQRDDFLARGVEQLRDFVDPNCCQIETSARFRYSYVSPPAPDLGDGAASPGSAASRPPGRCVGRRGRLAAGVIADDRLPRPGLRRRRRSRGRRTASRPRGASLLRS